MQLTAAQCHDQLVCFAREFNIEWLAAFACEVLQHARSVDVAEQAAAELVFAVGTMLEPDRMAELADRIEQYQPPTPH